MRALRLSTAMATMAATAGVLAVPTLSSAAPGCPKEVSGRVAPSLAKCARAASKPSGSTQLRQAATDPQTTPPLHGTDPHGQGTVAVIDTNPDPKRPYSSDPTGRTDNEDIVVGRSRGEQRADGTYHGHITIAALFGNEILGVDTVPGQTRTGPLEAAQQALLDPLCTGTGMSICLSAVTADSTTTATGSTNRFTAADAKVGGASGINVTAAESVGNITSDGTCQTSTGSSQVASAAVGATVVAGASKSSSVSKACNDGTAPTVTNTSSVITLGGTGVPLPAAGCANGTPDTVTGVPTLLPIVCNADDSSATGGTQATAPYGVREALDVFMAATGATQASKQTTAAAESRAVAPAPAAQKKAQCEDGIDNDGDGKIDFPADPGCSSAKDDDETDAAAAQKKAECEDGRDNDGDGKIDFPDDPGCSSAKDDDETNDDGGNKGGGGNPECSDKVDNDGDGKIDFPNDPGCSSADDDSEANGSGALPFTGVDLGLVLLLGSGALGTGLVLLALGRRRGGAPRRGTPAL